MVSLTKILSTGLLLAAEGQFRDVGAPELAAKEQYDIVKYLAAAGPYLQHPGYGMSLEIPDGAKLELVQLLSRHGERYPGLSAGLGHQAVVNRLQSYNQTIKGPLSFLNDYIYYVPTQDLYEYETNPSNSKSPYSGYDDLVKLGSYFRSRYNELYNPNASLPLFIAASRRVYDSALYFAQGFLGEAYSDNAITKVVVSENSTSGINSLTPRWGCTAFNLSSNAALSSKYPTKYVTDIITRLTAQNPGMSISSSDVTTFFQICAYELAATGYSPFCGLFSQDEFVNYGYSQDVGFYYSSGPGGNYSKEVGYVQLNATLALLKDDSATNKVWLTFTHDTDMEIFHSALGLFDTINPLPVDRIEVRDSYHHVNIVPMGARTITEKLSYQNETYVRFIVNDALVPIPSCANGPGFSCKLADFEAYVNNRFANLQFKSTCKVPDNVPQNLTFYWDYESQPQNYDGSVPRITM